MKPESAACSQGDRTSITEGPCLTSGSSSEISSATKVRRNTSSSLMVVEKNRRKLGSNHIRRRAEAILRLLSRGGCASEERIKKFLGDSPHTSKALQMLLKFDKVKQTGVGGRADHFIYIVGKGARSKAMYRSTMDRKPEPPTIEPKNEACPQGERTTSTTEGPCLTSGGSSEISSARKVRGNSSFSSVVVEQKIRRRFGSNHIRLRKEAILRLLSLGGCALEVRIRQFLGDSPDTSEALRMLLKLEEVKLSGAGGRADPFVYAIAASDKRSMTA